ncbi:Unconventional Myosin-Viia [Manis pentadactyla]|nr:Unconventional Myosin-Viia [Manis pentadactyla]
MAGKVFQAVGRFGRTADAAFGAQKVAAKIMRSLEGALRSLEEVLRSFEEVLRSTEEALDSPDGVISDLAEPTGKFAAAMGAPGWPCKTAGGPCQEGWSCRLLGLFLQREENAYVAAERNPPCWLGIGNPAHPEQSARSY